MNPCILFVVLLAAVVTGQEPATPLRVLATTTDLADLARRVGGDAVEVHCLLKGPEDPHFIDARPTFIREASRADVFVHNGLDLELGWAPLLLSESRNARIQTGTPGNVDCSRGIAVLDLPTGDIDRSFGDVHPHGNPHYLLDPLAGKVVARTLRDAFTALRPAAQKGLAERCAALERAVDVALFGDKLLQRFTGDTLGELLAQGRLIAFLTERKADADLGGWAKVMAPLAGMKIVSYHGGGLRYFVHRFHLEVAAALEPKPGVSPSPGHLAQVVATIKAQGVRGVFHAIYNERGAVKAVTDKTGARAALFAHQTLALPAATDWLAMLDCNVRLFADTLGKP